MFPLPTIYTYPSKSPLTDALATFILKCQATALVKHSKFKIAVSGGSLPVLLSSPLLLDNPTTEFSKWEIFFADERAVPLDHEDSNFGLLKKEFLNKIPKNHPHGYPTVIPIDDKLLGDIQEMADSYEQALVKSFAAKDSVKVPVFDLMLLGCGPDGHTCSLFPGHELLREDIAWVAPIKDSPKPPSKRITLTLPVITHATRVAFVAMGGGKKEILKTIFEHPEEGLPCSLVNVSGEKIVWFVDDAAVEGISTGNMRRGSL